MSSRWPKGLAACQRTADTYRHLNAEIEATVADGACKRLLSISGIGVFTASAMVASIGDAM